MGWVASPLYPLPTQTSLDAYVVLRRTACGLFMRGALFDPFVSYFFFLLTACVWISSVVGFKHLGGSTRVRRINLP